MSLFIRACLCVRDMDFAEVTTSFGSYKALSMDASIFLMSNYTNCYPYWQWWNCKVASYLSCQGYISALRKKKKTRLERSGNTLVCLNRKVIYISLSSGTSKDVRRQVISLWWSAFSFITSPITKLLKWFNNSHATAIETCWK